MKRILFLFAVSIIIIASPAQQVNSYVIEGRNIFPLDENGNISYSEIVKADSVNSKELYVRAHSWFANNFKSANSVIQLEDKEAGKIIGKGYYNAGILKSNSGVVKSSIIVSIHFTIDIQTKDDKYRYQFTNFSCIRNENTAYEISYDLMSSSFTKNAVWQKSLDNDWMEVKMDVNSKMLAIIESLKEAMNTPTDNW